MSQISINVNVSARIVSDSDFNDFQYQEKITTVTTNDCVVMLSLLADTLLFLNYDYACEI